MEQQKALGTTRVNADVTFPFVLTNKLDEQSMKIATSYPFLSSKISV